MKPEKFFVGDIKECTKYENHSTFNSQLYVGDVCIGGDSFGYVKVEDDIYKKDAVLLKVCEGGYVDIENLNSVLDYLKVYKKITKDGFYLGNIIMSTSAHCEGSLFVDSETIRPYFENPKEIGNISVRRLKKDNKKEN